MGVGVDESGRDGEAAGVDDAPGSGLRKVADGLDALALDPNVGLVAGGAGAVNDGAPGDDYVKHSFPRPSFSCKWLCLVGFSNMSFLSK